MKSVKLIVIFVGIIAAFVSGLLIGGGGRSGDEDSVPSAGKAAPEVRMVTVERESAFTSAANELSKKV